MTHKSKAEQILRLHPEGLTTGEAAMKYGCYKLPSRVVELQRKGLKIAKEYKPGSDYIHYRLLSESEVKV